MDYQKFTIRIASDKDWQLYRDIRLSALKNNPEVYSSTHSDALNFSEDTWKSILLDKNSIFLFAEVNSAIVGVARVTFDDPEEKPSIAVLGGLYVSNDFRNHEIATSLLEERIRICKNTSKVHAVRAYIKEHNTPAINLYKKNKFKSVGMKDGEIIMERIIR